MADPRSKEIYAGTGFFNVGYWRSPTDDQRTACENMVERLCEPLPATSARVLDAGCGWGAATACVRQYLPGSCVVGINISWTQLQRCIAAAADCRFALVDAARLAFRDARFDGVVSVEAAFHFRSRVSFLREAHRVLRPGGRLSLSDVVFADPTVVGEWMAPPENAIQGPEEYGALLTATGFENVRFTDATEECWWAFCAVRMEASRRRYADGQLDERSLSVHLAYFEALRDSVRHYLWISADKPYASGPSIC
jgi:cyclopropane fatty-acyl-phospholipid synthase-like methyltransferase